MQHSTSRNNVVSLNPNLSTLQAARALLDKLIAQNAPHSTKPGLAKAAAAPPSRAAIEAQQDAKLLAACQGKTLWLPEATAASGLSKQIATTAARRLAYAEKLWLTLEPGPRGKLTTRLRSRERMVAE